MKHYLFPNEQIKSTYDIDFEKLYKKGYRGLIFDIDNTLVPHGFPADERAMDLFRRLHAIGFRWVLLSNNGKVRVKSFWEKVGGDYIFRAGKPKPANYHKAMERMGTDGDTTIFVGDQIFTDVMGANRAGIRTILVEPIHHKEIIWIAIKRYFEKIVLFFYRRYQKKEGNQAG